MTVRTKKEKKNPNVVYKDVYLFIQLRGRCSGAGGGGGGVVVFAVVVKETLKISIINGVKELGETARDGEKEPKVGRRSANGGVGFDAAINYSLFAQDYGAYPL